MPFPIHPRPGHLSNIVHPPLPLNTSSSSTDQRVGNSAPSKGMSFSGRNVLFACMAISTVFYPALSPPHLALSVSLALALLLILAFQFWPFSASLNGVKPFFTEIRLKMDGEEFSIFGRKLEMSTGDYFLDIPYARANRFQAILC
jgi:hypothetical protein